MKVLIAVKRVIDYKVRVRVKPDGSDVDLNNTKMAMNPFCEIAVEEAVRLKEQGIADELVVVSVGPDTCHEQLRTALALGCDRAIQIKCDSMPDSLAVARLLHKLVEAEQPDLILLGKQAIDSDNNQTGQMLAALCGYAQGTFTSKLEVKGDEVEVTRELDTGLQTLALKLPAVVTTDLRLNTPRYAALPNIMKARQKPLDVQTPEELGVEISTGAKLLGVSPPEQRSGGIKVGSVDELLDKLRNEAKVLE